MKSKPIYDHTIEEIRDKFNNETLKPEEIDFARDLLMDSLALIEALTDFHINYGENKANELLFMVKVAMKKGKEGNHEPKL
jgi:hypothetical protein